MKKYIWIIMFLFVAGCLACAHSGGISKPVSYSFKIDIPEGWRKIDNNRYLFVTKESPFRQYIMVQNRPIGRSFRNTKKKMQKEMFPEEAAQIIVDELISDQNLVNLRILDNAPTTIKGHAGFKILYTYKDSEGRVYKTLYYGFIKEDTFFNLRFTATDRVYFQRDIGDFRSILKSFQIIKAETV
ncbi:MAG: hypothetical protein PVJ82_06420 [Desulfobacteraceae bacterium]|jgi:hypothetical protein